jgi:hypothetical protein
MKIEDYLHFYLGRNTNKGLLVGISMTSYYIDVNGETIAIDKHESIKPILRTMRSLTADEIEQLHLKGLSIGQRKGFSFTPEAIVYLLSLGIDIFNLINEGLAIEKP